MWVERNFAGKNCKTRKLFRGYREQIWRIYHFELGMETDSIEKKTHTLLSWDQRRNGKKKNLEKQNYNSVCIKKLMAEEEKEITNLEEIIQEQKCFYQKLYTSQY